ncbi:hypothetical protein D3C81_1556860 [compost metagenome]
MRAGDGPDSQANERKHNNQGELQDLEDRLRSRWAANVKEKIRALRRLEVECKHSAEVRAELRRANEEIWNDQELINKLTARVAKAESENEHGQRPTGVGRGPSDPTRRSEATFRLNQKGQSETKVLV